MKALLALLLLTPDVTPEAALVRIQAKVRVAPVAEGIAEVAGQYSNSDGLAASELYLFPDGTYVYAEWADIAPLKVYERGRWLRSGAGVTLLVEWRRFDAVRAERAYVVLRWPKDQGGALLVGVDQALDYFEQNSGREPRLMLNVVGLRRLLKITSANAGSVRASLPTSTSETDAK